ncbi:MAG TPA: hypothetical protein V6D15_16575 [Oculatellaceae cyanobacterium]
MAIIKGTTGNDNLQGTEVKHLLQGLAGNDSLTGLDGNDTLEGGIGIDTLKGGNGNDTYVVDDIADVVSETDANGGTDTINSSIDWTLGNFIENLNLSGTAISGTGNELDNTIAGNSGNNSISGGDGKDHLRGDAGDDTLDGGNGNDYLDGGSGVDYLIGGSGNDTYLVDRIGDIVTETDANGGTDLVKASVNWTLGANIENLTLTGSAISGMGNASNNTIAGNTANNTLSGGDGNDLLNGGAGDDNLDGGQGNDNLNGGIGNDTMSGGDGDDVYVVDSISDITTETSATGGTDRVTASVNWTLNANIENLYLSGAAISGTGNASNNTIAGNAADNTLSGADGNDTLSSGNGNDTVLGEVGNDSLNGGLGNDSLDGGDGDDTLSGSTSASGQLDILTGGNGQDLFVLGNAFASFYDDGDVTTDGTADYALIKDFVSGTDRLRLADEASNYLLNATTGSLPAGTGIYLDKPGAEPDELLGIVEDVTGLTLSSADFVFGVLPVNLSNVEAGTGGFVINGQAIGDFSGRSVSNAGDVNGDGLDDIIVGAYRATPVGDSKAGKSYVVFGKSDTTAVNLSAVEAGTSGFVINGTAEYDFSGFSVSNAGDVNGDGLDDLIVGAKYADSAGGTNAGKSYVVFGKSDTTAVNLSEVEAGTGGFVINGAAEYDNSGFSVSNAGDVNGDGLDDLIVGASAADPAGETYAGKSYVVFGKSDTTTVNLSAVETGTGGFVINGTAAEDFSGRSVSNAGDVNGDGLDDLIVGASSATPAGGTNAGKSYVVFGKSNTTAVNLSTVEAGTGGFVINGAAEYDFSGFSVSNAGDVNGDGFSDLIVGAYGADSAGGTNSGKSYVVFGKSNTTAVNLSAVEAGTGGFVINGTAEYDYSGISVSNAGDVNGDGLDDLIVGAAKADPAGATYDSKSYVVFGKSDTTVVNLSALEAGTGGFVINGAAEYDNSGISVSNAGDVNGDGFSDLIVGANLADPSEVSNAGKSYVIYGGNFTGAVTQRGTAKVDVLTGISATDVIVGGMSDDILTGGGGADVLYGGAGDDILGISDTSFKRIDGGTGNDTLRVNASLIGLDLTSIANNLIMGIEQIDLTGTGDNSLTFTKLDLQHLSDDGNQLIVLGNAGDTITSTGQSWIAGSTETIGSNLYQSYTVGNSTLLVDTDITRNIS